MQNYLIWRLVLDRISSLSQRFKEARASYRKVSDTPPPWLSLYTETGRHLSLYNTDHLPWAKHQSPPWGQSHD